MNLRWRGAASAVVAVLVGALGLSLFRLLLWWVYKPADALPVEDLRLAFWVGARFDLKTFAIAVAEVGLLVAAGAWLARRLRGYQPGERLFFWALFAAFAPINLICTGNHYYFGFYGTPISPIVFGLGEDDTGAVLYTIWKDYPLLRALSAWLALSLAQSGLALLGGRWLGARLAALPRAARIVAGVATFVLLFYFARGSFGTFPLREQHLSVSSHAFINNLTPNGAYALRLAVNSRLSEKIGDDPTTGLRNLGYKTPQDAARRLGLAGTSDEELLRAMYRRTPRNESFAKRPPHVVFALMESMGRDILDYQQPGNEVLGRFAPFAQAGLLWRNFTSVQHGTHPTVEGLLFNSPITPLTLSAAGDRRLASSAVLPYRTAGYRTVYLTSVTGHWRRMDQVLVHQGFDEVIDSAALKKRYAEAVENAWGVDDEVMFRRALELLDESERSGKPLFLFMKSTSNHAPFEWPAGYKPAPLDPAVFGGRQPPDAAQARNMLEAYQYAADALGVFMQHLKAGPLWDHTLVAMTGDHNTRNFFRYEGGDELPRQYGVPFYLHLPPAYVAGGEFHAERIGSHRDMFPTLYHHSLSEACYLVAGHDMLGTDHPSRGLALFDWVVTPEGVAHGLKSPVYRTWEQPYERLNKEPAATPPAALVDALERERAYVGLLDWQVRMEVLDRMPAEPCGP